MVKVFLNKATKKVHADKRGDRCRQRMLHPSNLVRYTGETELDAILNVQGEYPKAKPCGHCLKDVEIE